MNKPVKNDILKQLYHGDICPAESAPCNNPVYTSACTKAIAIRNEIEQVLPPNKRYLLEQLQEWQNERSMIELQSTYEVGFRMGAQIIMAIHERDIGDISIIVHGKEGDH